MAREYRPKPGAEAYTGDMPNPNPGYLPTAYDDRGNQSIRPDYDRPPTPRTNPPDTGTPGTGTRTGNGNNGSPENEKLIEYGIYALMAAAAIYIIYTFFK